MWDSALESLGEEECLALLKQVEFGRVVVVTAEGRPEIFPVNFIVHGRTVVFTTASSVLQARRAVRPRGLRGRPDRLVDA